MAGTHMEIPLRTPLISVYSNRVQTRIVFLETEPKSNVVNVNLYINKM